MRYSVLMALGMMMWQNAASAQGVDKTAPPAAAPQADAGATGVVGELQVTTIQEYKPLTSSERWRRYFVGGFGPGAILKAAVAGGITQWAGVPKEWKGGAQGYGYRVGSSYAKHAIESTLENGAAALLHEDNRYFRSTETGFLKRSKHVIASTLIARNDAGAEHFAFSRVGGAAGAAFISRAWQPRSTTSAGDGAVSFGISMATKVGWNFFKEFRPGGKDRN